MDSIQYNNKIFKLLDDKNSYEQFTQQTKTKNVDIFNKLYKKSKF